MAIAMRLALPRIKPAALHTQHTTHACHAKLVQMRLHEVGALKELARWVRRDGLDAWEQAELLAELATPAVNNARKEAAEIQKVIDAQKGGYVQESAQSTESRNNWNVALNAGGNLSSKTPTAADEKASSDHGLNAGAKVGVDYLRGTTQQNSQIKADTVALNSAGAVPAEAARALGQVSRWCLVISIAALGVKTSFEKLAALGWTLHRHLKAGAVHAHLLQRA